LRGHFLLLDLSFTISHIERAAAAAIV